MRFIALFQTFIYCFYFGFAAESTDPNVVTYSELNDEAPLFDNSYVEGAADADAYAVDAAGGDGANEVLFGDSVDPDESLYYAEGGPEAAASVDGYAAVDADGYAVNAEGYAAGADAEGYAAAGAEGAGVEESTYYGEESWEEGAASSAYDQEVTEESAYYDDQAYYEDQVPDTSYDASLGEVEPAAQQMNEEQYDQESDTKENSEADVRALKIQQMFDHKIHMRQLRWQQKQERAKEAAGKQAEEERLLMWQLVQVRLEYARIQTQVRHRYWANICKPKKK